MTFKTKFRIGQEVIFEEAKRKIIIVSIFVGENFKSVQYYLENCDDMPIIANEADVKHSQ